MFVLYMSVKKIMFIPQFFALKTFFYSKSAVYIKLISLPSFSKCVSFIHNKKDWALLWQVCTCYLPIICIICVSLVPWQALQGPSNPEQASSRLLGGQNLLLYTVIITCCTSKIIRKSQINLGVRNEKLQDEQKDKTKREYCTYRSPL